MPDRGLAAAGDPAVAGLVAPLAPALELNHRVAVTLESAAVHGTIEVQPKRPLIAPCDRTLQGVCGFVPATGTLFEELSRRSGPEPLAIRGDQGQDADGGEGLRGHLHDLRCPLYAERLSNQPRQR